MLTRVDLRSGLPDGAALRGLLPRAAVDVAAATAAVEPIVADVRARGVAAVREATERFDRVTLAEIRVDADLVRLAVLRQLHHEARLARLDAVARRLLGHRDVELGAGLPGDLLREHALGVGDAELLAVDHDLRLGGGLAVEARLDLDVDALAAGAEQDRGGEQGDKPKLGCSHVRPSVFFPAPLLFNYAFHDRIHIRASFQMVILVKTAVGFPFYIPQVQEMDMCS